MKIPMITVETQRAQMALEEAIGRPYSHLLLAVQEEGIWTEADLLRAGQVLFEDMVRMSKGAISSIQIPCRLGDFIRSVHERLAQAA